MRLALARRLRAPVLAVAIGSLASSPPAMERPAFDSPLRDEVRFGDYLLVIKRREPGSYDPATIDIYQRSELVFHDEADQFRFGASVGSPDDPVPMGTDVTGDGVPDLVVGGDQGSAAGLPFIDVFEIGPRFRLVASIDGGRYPPRIIDFDGDGIPEIVAADDTFTFFGTLGHVGVPIVLRFAPDEQRYRLATEFMGAPVPDDLLVADDSERERSPVLDFLQLAYTGHASLARARLDDGLLLAVEEHFALGPYAADLRAFDFDP